MQQQQLINQYEYSSLDLDGLDLGLDTLTALTLTSTAALTSPVT
jgi:hypothetical protein